MARPLVDPKVEYGTIVLGGIRDKAWRAERIAALQKWIAEYQDELDRLLADRLSEGGDRER